MRCTGSIPQYWSESFFRSSSMLSGSMTNLFLSTSTKAGSNPVSSIALLVAMYVRGLVIIFLPLGILYFFFFSVRAAMRADVPELTTIASFVPMYFAQLLSKILMLGLLSDIHPLSVTSLRASFSSGPILSSPHLTLYIIQQKTRLFFKPFLCYDSQTF